MRTLFKKYIVNQCSPKEVKDFLAYFRNPENEFELRGLILETLEDVDIDDDLNKESYTIGRTFEVIDWELNTETNKVVYFDKRTCIRVAIAVAMIVGGFSLFNFINGPQTGKGIRKVVGSGQNLAASDDKAVLTLSDGSGITLENASNGILTIQGDAQITINNNGELIYKLLTEKPSKVIFNTLAIPRGGKYQISLSDGSRVWLNAASSLRFPAAFIGTERKVQLTGEAYFEIAKNTTMPFKVAIEGKGEIEVVGTHFNVNAYNDEATVNTTLLEGSVRIKGPGSVYGQILNPGQQAQVTSNGQITIEQNVNTAQAMAWKNGAFHFTNADAAMVLRQISRWYDVDIVFEGPIPSKQFNGEIKRHQKLSEVVKLLEKNSLPCRLEGIKLIVQNR